MPNNYLVIGPGRTGLFWAYALAASGGTVLLHGRGEKHIRLLGSNDEITTHWYEPAGSVVIQTVRGVRFIASYAHLAREDKRWFVIPAVRSYQVFDATGKAAVWLKDRLAGVIVPTNGIEAEAIVANVLDDPAKVFSAALTLPCEKDPADPRAVHIRNPAGGIGIGAYASAGLPVLDSLARDFRSCQGLAVATYAEHWASMKWTKLAMNVIGNVLCALTLMNPGDLYRNWPMAALELRLLHEIDLAMQANGLELVELPGYPTQTLRRIFALARLSQPAAWPAAKLYQLLVVPKIIQSRGGKEPSLLQEIRGHARQVENLPLQVAEACGQLTRPPPLPICRFLGQALANCFSRLTAWGMPDHAYISRPGLLWQQARIAPK